MTDRERAIVMAYTGITMLCGDKLGVFYEYVSEKLGRPIYTHEFVDQANTIQRLAKDDFFSLCAGKPYPKPKLGTPPYAMLKVQEKSGCDGCEDKGSDDCPISHSGDGNFVCPNGKLKG